MSNLLDISAAELRSYLQSMQNVRFDGQAFILESRKSRLVLDFTSMDPYTLTLKMKRLGGNGQFSVLEDSTSYRVGSLVLQEIVIPGQTTLTIERGDDSKGEIALVGIVVKEIMMLKNWKYLLNNCQHSGIRQAGDKLLATAGAFLHTDYLESVTTEPPGIAEISSQGAQFPLACQITDLVLKKTTSLIPGVPLFPHREGPTPQMTPLLPAAKVPALMPSPAVKIPVVEAPRPSLSVVYNSDQDTNFTFKYKTGNKLVRSINSNGDPWMVIKKGGVFQAPISSLDPGASYSLIYDGKRNGGNGKMYVTFYNENNQPILRESLYLEKIGIREHRFTTPAEKISAMSWSMDQADSSGEVLLRKIIIMPAQTAVNYIKSGFSLENISQETILKDIILPENKRFVIVIPSYKNITWCDKNIISCLDQEYSNFRIIFTDDCSPDGTFDKVKEIVDKHPNRDKATLIKNEVRKGAMENLYDMIWSCADDEIIVTVDGDDWLAHTKVLNKLNEVYSQGDVWLTYGQFQEVPSGNIGLCKQIPDYITKTNAYQRYDWCSSHLRTFYTWLFKNIKKQDLFYQGRFAASGWDCCLMFPMLSMAGFHSKFVPDILLMYNLMNELNDHKVDVKLQQDSARYFRNLPPYQPLAKPSLYQKISIALTFVATGKYDQFLQGIISSADSFFLPGYDVEYYVFTDKSPFISSSRKVHICPVTHRAFPFASIDRYKHFLQYQDKLLKHTHMYYCDVDSLFVDHVRPDEIVGDLVCVQHCGYFGQAGPVENNVNSCLYRAPHLYKSYSGGGFSGGLVTKYLDAAQWCWDKITQDINNGIHPRVDDETAWNTYLVDNPATITLSPSYHYPASNLPHYKKIWRGNNFNPKILLLDKDHASVRL